MSRKTEVFKRHHAIIEIGQKICALVTDDESIKNRKIIVALAEDIETEAKAALELTREILEEYEFDDLGPTE